MLGVLCLPEYVQTEAAGFAGDPPPEVVCALGWAGARGSQGATQPQCVRSLEMDSGDSRKVTSVTPWGDTRNQRCRDGPSAPPRRNVPSDPSGPLRGTGRRGGRGSQKSESGPLRQACRSRGAGAGQERGGGRRRRRRERWAGALTSDPGPGAGGRSPATSWWPRSQPGRAVGRAAGQPRAQPPGSGRGPCGGLERSGPAPRSARGGRAGG